MRVSIARSGFYIVLSIAFFGGFRQPIQAAIQVRAATSPAAPQPVGTQVTLLASASDSNAGPVTFKFEVAPPGSNTFSVLRDFSVLSSFTWAPSLTDGTYTLRITARDYLANQSSQTVMSYQVTSLVAGKPEAVTATSNSLVALFSAPGCPAGSSMRVSFQALAGTPLPVQTFTDWRPCLSSSMNFYIAGMAPNQAYTMNYQVQTGSTVTNGPSPVTFMTGGVSTFLPIAPATIPIPKNSADDQSNPIVLTGYSPLPGLVGNIPASIPVATSLDGTILWYYPLFTQLTRPLAGGTMLMITNSQGTGTGVWGNQNLQWDVREIDLCGNVLRETNVDRVNEQLTAMGTDVIGRFHHDAIRLPNGTTMVFGDVQRAFPAGAQGSPVPVDIIGDMIIQLDANFQVMWFWNAFDHTQGSTQLNLNRAATLNETCSGGSEGCPPALLPGFNQASDWLHSNSIQYLPGDGNLLVSLHNQDWVIKIDYENGSGSQRILWRMGQGADFNMIAPGVTWAWFSGQHDVAFEDTAQTTLSMLDNGLTRVLAIGGNSRGQVLQVNQNNLTVSLQLNADLGVFATMLGSAQALANGDYMFAPGFIGLPANANEQSIEIAPSGTPVYEYNGQAPSYRSWRLPSLYNPPSS